MFTIQLIRSLGSCVFALLLVTMCAPAYSADNLRLAPGLSFNSDLDRTFPIIGDNMDDATIQPGQPTFIFFGAAGDLNTNRQAKRYIDMYKKEHGHGAKFIVIDVDHPNNDSERAIIGRYYQGYIPEETLIDKNGQVVWNEVGEVSRHQMHAQIGGTM